MNLYDDFNCFANSHMPMGHVAQRFVVKKCRTNVVRAIRLYRELARCGGGMPNNAQNKFLTMLEYEWFDGFPDNRIRPNLPG